jgi:cell division protein FtsL
MKKDLIRSIFLYLTAFVGVVMTAIGTVGLVNLTLEELVFGVDEPSFPRAPNA